MVNDKDLACAIKGALREKAKSGFLTAADIMEVVSGPDIQEQLAHTGIFRPSISKSTACRWLGKLGWLHGRHQNGMYVDGHECEDVVEYRKGFVERFEQYERRFHTWDDEGNEQQPSIDNDGMISHFQHQLVLITHDELTFYYQNDQQKIYWACPGKNVAPRPKGEGLTLMVSDFLTADWGRLRHNDRCAFADLFPPQNLSLFHSEAHIIFQAGKNRDGWFTADHLLTQVDKAITIFKEITKGDVQALFLFDNAPSHQKHADDALSACLMVKGASYILP